MSLKNKVIAAGGGIALALSCIAVGAIPASAATVTLKTDNTSGSITISTSSGSDVKHTLWGYRLASFDQVTASGITVTGYRLKTTQTTTLNPSYQDAIAGALNSDTVKNAVSSENTGITDLSKQIPQYSLSLYGNELSTTDPLRRNNPMGYVAEYFTGHPSLLRTFAEEVSKQLGNLTVTQLESAGDNFKVMKNGNNTVAPGYWLLLDKTDESTIAGRESLSTPILVPSTVTTSDGTVLSQLQAVGETAASPLGQVTLKNNVLPIGKQVVGQVDKPTPNNADDGAYAPNDNPSYAVGDLVDYELLSQTPDFTGYQFDPTMLNAKKTRQYAISDTMSRGLDFVAVKSVQLYTRHSSPEGVVSWTLDKTLNASSDYDVNVSNNVDVAGDYAGGKTVTVDLKRYVNKAVGSTRATSTDEIPANQKVVVIVQCRLNQNALISTSARPQGNKNKSSLTFSNDPSDNSLATKIPGGETEVYTFQFNLHKVDTKDSSKTLQGAMFTVQADGGLTGDHVGSGTNAHAGKYLICKDASGAWLYGTEAQAKSYSIAKNSDGKFIVKTDENNIISDTGTTNHEIAQGAANKLSADGNTLTISDSTNGVGFFVTDADGNVAVSGLKAGTYHVSEVKAPKDYLDADLQKINFSVFISADYVRDKTQSSVSQALYPYPDGHWGDNTLPAFGKDSSGNSQGTAAKLTDGSHGDQVTLGTDTTSDISIATVANAKTYTQLPLTGATTMRILAILAVVIAAVGAVFVVRGRRMNK